MIDEVDHVLKKWIASVIDSKYEITFHAPQANAGQSAVIAYLYHMENDMPRSTAREIPLQIMLTYLLLVQTEDPLEAHRILGNLLFAAKARSDLEVDFPVLPATYWQAFGIPPAPYFCLRVPLRMDREQQQIPRVKSAPQINIASTQMIDGLILGPADIPIAGAKITLNNSNSIAYSNNNGLFSINADAKSKQNFNCLIHAKGKQFSISVPIPETQQAPLTIHLDNLEV